MYTLSKDSISLNTDSLSQDQKTLHCRGVFFGYRVVLSDCYVARAISTVLARQAHFLAFAGLAIASSFVPLAAQSTFPPPFPDPATCPIKAGIKSFVLEEPIGGTSFTSAFTATFPAAALAAFTDANSEVRVHFSFDTSDMIAYAWTIAVPKGSPAITPSTTNFDAISLATAVAQINRIETVCYPRPSILISGPLTSGQPVFGAQNGIPHGMAFSFDPASTTNINNAQNVLTFDAGTSEIVVNLASAIVIPAAVSAVISGAPALTAIHRDFVLDGTASASASGPMTYAWSVPPGVNVGILDPMSPQTSIRIGGPAGDYPVTLTVTTPFASASSKVTVHYAPDFK